MQLLRGKVAGHFVVKNSDWFTCDRLTVIVGEEGSGKTTFLRALRSINPPLFDNDPAPFADFPKFVIKGGLQRKVITAKKTASIAVYVCDDDLREELAAIDPVFLETDRIEVGRRLDASHWMTFVEIAASSRWSELAGNIERLREKARNSGDAELLDGFAVCETLQPADRIKGKVAEELRTLLTTLERRIVTDEELRSVIEQARFLVDRADRFIAARRLVRRRLPVLQYLQGGGLLQGEIDLESVAEDLNKGEGLPRHGLDLYFLALVGLSPEELREKGPAAAADHLRRRLAEQDDVCRGIADLVRQWLPDCGFSLTSRLRHHRVELQARLAGEDVVSLDALSPHLRWLVSCATTLAYYRDVPGRGVVLLLDEPDADCTGNEIENLFMGLRGLSAGWQCVLASAHVSAGREGERAYVLDRENGEQGSVLRPLSS